MKKPRHLRPAHAAEVASSFALKPVAKADKALTGVDVFLDWDEAGRDPEVLGARLEKLGAPEMRLVMVTNRGVKVYPEGFPETFCTDHWRCRFVAAEGAAAPSHKTVLALLDASPATGWTSSRPSTSARSTASGATPWARGSSPGDGPPLVPGRAHQSA